jgi:hypothetical protein
MSAQLQSQQGIHLPIPEELFALTRQELDHLEKSRATAAEGICVAALSTFISTGLNAVAILATNASFSSVAFLLNAGVTVASLTLGLAKLTVWISARRSLSSLRASIEARPVYYISLSSLGYQTSLGEGVETRNSEASGLTRVEPTRKAC